MVVLIIAHKNKVLVNGGKFLSGEGRAGETELETCRRIALEQASCSIGTTWPYDTDVFIARYSGEGEPADMLGFEWLSRDDLGTHDWDSAFGQLARQLGAYWDQVFMSEHW